MDFRDYTEVLINGKIYRLGGENDDAYFQRIAAYINMKLEDIKSKTGYSRMSDDYKNVMMYINLADDYFKMDNQCAKLRRDQENHDSEIYALKHELVNLKMTHDVSDSEAGKIKKELEEANTRAIDLQAQVNLAGKQVSEAKVLEEAARQKNTRLLMELDAAKQEIEKLREEVRDLQNLKTAVQRANTQQRTGNYQNAPSGDQALNNQRFSYQEKYSDHNNTGGNIQQGNNYTNNPGNVKNTNGSNGNYSGYTGNANGYNGNKYRR